MRIVIIGHTGFIGNNIYQNLINNKENEILGISTNEIDLTKDKSAKTLSEILTPDCVVIMCAGIKKQLGDNLETFESNLNIVINFSKAISVIQPKKIIFFSSASVYGEDVAYPEMITEKTVVQPKTYYGIGKYAAEILLKKTCGENSIQLVIIRPPLVYGKDDLSRGYGPTGFTFKAIYDEEIILWGDGSEFREFVYVGDVGKIVSRLVNSNYNGILNIVSGTSHSYKEILDVLKKIMDLNIKVEYRTRTKEKVDHHYSNDLIHDALGNFEFTNLKDGLAQTHCAIINTLKGINEDRQRS
jgi:nucleoside-diphosphate-sugar epimerase|tara:strand:+ start:874 stop:1773 length:900 start_codon:yes stop_codon:yes gene_type:complete